MKSIATHKHPDTDALVAAWLAERFLFGECESQICFVEYSFDPQTANPFDCVVDVGRIHSPARLIFDHKSPGYPDRHASCAAKLLWEHLIAEGHCVQYLADLVQVVHDGDSIRLRAGSAAYKTSRASGLHAAVKRLKGQGLTDDALYNEIRTWLDRNYVKSPGRTYRR